MWELDCEESWVQKNWCFWTVVLEKTLESPLDCKRSNQFFGRNNAKGEAPVLWPPHAKSWLIGKDCDAGRIGGRSRRGRLRMRWLDGITDSMDMNLSVSGNWWWTGKPGGLRFMGCKESDTTEWLNWTEVNWTELSFFNDFREWALYSPHSLKCSRAPESTGRNFYMYLVPWFFVFNTWDFTNGTMATWSPCSDRRGWGIWVMDYGN